MRKDNKDLIMHDCGYFVYKGAIITSNSMRKKLEKKVKTSKKHSLLDDTKNSAIESIRWCIRACKCINSIGIQNKLTRVINQIRTL